MDLTLLFIKELLLLMNNNTSLYTLLDNYREYNYRVEYKGRSILVGFNETTEKEIIKKILKEYYDIPVCSDKKNIFNKGCSYIIQQDKLLVSSNKKEFYIKKEKIYLENFFLSPSVMLKKKLEYKRKSVKDFAQVSKAKGFLLGALCFDYLDNGNVKTLNQCDVRYFFVSKVDSNKNITLRFLDKTTKEVDFDKIYYSIQKCSAFLNTSWLFEEWFL